MSVNVHAAKIELVDHLLENRVWDKVERSELAREIVVRLDELSTELLEAHCERTRNPRTEVPS